MKVVDELDFYDIKTTSWGGAVETAQKIYDADKEHDFECLIDELYPEGINRTQLNDILWFESDWLYETLGINEDEEV